MLRVNSVVLSALFMVLGCAGVASATTYFTDIGTYSGSTIPIPFGDLADARNASGGEIVTSAAMYWQGANPQNTSGTTYTLNPSWGAGAVKDNAISSDGTKIAGRCYSNGSQVTPFLYNVGDPVGTATDLSPKAGYGPSATGINNAGVIVFGNLTYLLPGAGSAVALPNSSGGGNGPFHSMSSNGNIIGSDTSGSVPQLWTPIVSGGTITGYNSPIALGDGSNGSSYAVNNAGEGAGYYYFNGNMNPTTGPALLVAGHAYPFWTGDTSDTGYALGINSNGTVVGMSSFEGLYGGGVSTDHAFIWTPTVPNGTTGTVEDLNVKYASLKPAGYTFTVAVDINDNGDILGVMYNGGTKHLFLISTVPAPEPSTLLLAASGLIGLLAYAWRKRK